MARIHDMADTWNDAGTVYTGIKLNVTDTASDSGSLLMDLQVGGASQFSVTKSGDIYANMLRSGALKTGFSIENDYNCSVFIGNALHMQILNTGTTINAGKLTLGTNATSTGVVLARDEFNILAQRNGTNPQEFRLYNTYTNSTDYERGFMRWNSDVLEIGTEADGTGSSQRKVDYKISSQSGIRGGTADWRDITFYNSLWSLNFDLSAYAITPSAGVDLGKTTAPFQDIYLKPSSSLTPNANGDLCIEATNDTTLTFKLKGSDGTVRSGTVTLA